MRMPSMARRSGLGFLIAALVGVLAGNFFMPAFGYWAIGIGVLAAVAVDVYLRNRAWRRQQREAAEAAEAGQTPDSGPASRREDHRPASQRAAGASGRQRRRRRRR